MKRLLLTAIVLVSAFANAANEDVTLTPLAISGSSMGPKAAELIQMLKDLGVQPTTHDGVTNYRLAKGLITMTNGAFCDDGTTTFEVSFDVVDGNDRALRHVDLDGSQECQGTSRAKKFSDMMDVFGAKKLGGDCGLGHCWTTVNRVDCTHFDNSKFTDMCGVLTSNGMREETSAP